MGLLGLLLLLLLELSLSEKLSLILLCLINETMNNGLTDQGDVGR